MFVRQGRAYPAGVIPLEGPLREVVIDYLVRTLWALLALIAAILVGRGFRRLAMRALTRRKAHPNAVALLGTLSQVGTFVVVGLVIVAIYTQGSFGWILTSFSVVGLVIGLSLQDILRNFFSGVYVLVERPFRIGDTVQVDGHTGVVQDIGFRATLLRTDDGREVVVPNAMLMTNSLVNLTRYPVRSARLRVSVPADDALAEVPDRVRELLAGAESIADEPPPVVLLRGVLGDRAHYDITVWGADRDRAAADAISAIRAGGPQWEARGA
jgi:small-conductance mechanosensitive channel